MECKFDRQHKKAFWKGIELIDTLWNVNVYVEGTSPITTDELIDTLWNVNTVK